MIGVAHQHPSSLAHDPAVLEVAAARARSVLVAHAVTGAEPPSAALAIAVGAARLGLPEAEDLLTLVRRLFVRAPMGGEAQARCLRALARVGHPVDVSQLTALAEGSGRAARMALGALAERAARGDEAAGTALAERLSGQHAADAAMWLAHVCDEAALDALSKYIRAPGPTGLHAAAALLSAEEDPFAFESLVERLCRPGEAVAAARALWGADPRGTRLVEAEGVLSRWARRGVADAEGGRETAAVVRGAFEPMTDFGAALRALSSHDHDLTFHATLACWRMGDSERAHAAARALLKRAPLVSARTFQALCSWADVGDHGALGLVKRSIASRPVELSRAAMLEALAGCDTPALHHHVLDAVRGHDAPLALEAGRALMRLHEPPAVVPDAWL